MNKLSIAVIVLLIFGGGAYFLLNKNSPEYNSWKVLPNGFIQVFGTVNLNEVGGSNLSLASREYGESKIAADGSFETEIKAEKPQLLAVLEGDIGRPNAYAIVLPDDFKQIRIDSTSTTKAVLFPYLGISSTSTPQEIRAKLDSISNLKCFPKLHNFFKEKLVTTSFAELIQDDDYRANMQACVEEMLNKKFEMKKGSDIFESDWWPYDFSERSKRADWHK